MVQGQFYLCLLFSEEANMFRVAVVKKSEKDTSFSMSNFCFSVGVIGKMKMKNGKKC
jgi:hypothetical protein